MTPLQIEQSLAAVYQANQLILRQLKNLALNPTKRAMVGGRDRENGRFKTGNNGGGRPKGSRNKLGEAFLNDLVDAWDTHGATALQTCAHLEPTQFVKVVAGILPREILVSALTANVNIDLSQMEAARGFFAAFAYARQQIGAEPPAIDHLSTEAEVAWQLDDSHDDD